MNKKIAIAFIAILSTGINAFSQNDFPTTGNANLATTNYLRFGGRVYVQATNTGLSGNTRGIISNSVSWNTSTSKWAIGLTGSSVSDFSLLRFENIGGIGFFNGPSTGGYYEVDNEGLEQYRRMTILNDGKIGIGISSPESRLEVRGLGSLANLYNPAAAGIKISNGGNLIMDGNEIYSDGSLNIGVAPSGTLAFGPVDATTSFSGAFRVFGNGNVGIGTNDTKGYKFAVNGDAVFTKVVVKSYTTWPDYVFEPSYKLPSLQYVEQYINTNKHLPDVPSAADIENQGVDLANTQAALLRKIEELTLYVIELKKEVEELKTKNN
ncbi:hypothetical protein [Foetidibacter luteolus]|uniref:hypothetical protein n=1 Tax=Foetidibacter luteolus TaxID=2608880 RepID=UPI00129A9373|nr:hypothetical protein [Foetidibacter luteolus]